MTRFGTVRLLSYPMSDGVDGPTGHFVCSLCARTRSLDFFLLCMLPHDGPVGLFRRRVSVVVVAWFRSRVFGLSLVGAGVLQMEGVGLMVVMMMMVMVMVVMVGEWSGGSIIGPES